MNIEKKRNATLENWTKISRLHEFEDVDSNEMTLQRTLYSAGILYFLERLDTKLISNMNIQRRILYRRIYSRYCDISYEPRNL